MKIPKPLIVVFGVVATLILVVTGAILWIESETGQLWIERRASAATEREVSIGDIDVKIGWHPGFRVSGLRIGNPDWAQTDHLIDTEFIDARFRFLPLFAGRFVIEDLTLVQAKLGLEREENRNTWTFGKDKKDEDKPFPLSVRQINIDRGHVTYRDTTIKTHLEIDVAGDVGGAGAVEIVARGTFRGDKTAAVARIPALLPSKDTPVEISAAATLGDITGAAAGIVRSVDVDGIDLDLDISGASLADVKRYVPVNLPETPPYRLQGRVRNPKDSWIFDPFTGRVGDSDLSGGASYSTAGKRPLLKANLTSHLLDLDDLGPLVGAPPKTGPGETAAPKQKQQVQQIDQTGKVLPNKRFAVEDWPAMDADVRFEAKKIVDAARVPIEDLSAKWILEAGVLRFEPLRFRMADGQVVADISIDSNSKPPVGKTKIQVTGLNLRKLFPPKSGMMAAPLGALYARIDMTGRGASTAELFGSANGRLALLINGGHISNLLMEAVGLDLAEALRIIATKDVQVKLRCAVADLAIKDGVATPQVLVIDTEDTIVTATGTVDFRAEKLDLETKPEPKDPSPFVLRTPILIRGTFKDPDVKPKMGPVIARAAGGFLLGLINPLLGVLPFFEKGPGEDSDCGQLMQRVKAEGVKAPNKPAAGPTPK